MNVAYKNFSDKDSTALTGCVKQRIFGLVLKDITYLLCHFNIPLFMESCNFISKEKWRKLIVHLYMLSLQLFDQRKSVPQHL